MASALLLALVSSAAHAQQQRVTDGTTPSGLASGAPAGSYSLSGFEHVNPYNGSLSVNLPLLKVAGRGEVGFPMTLRINQKWLIVKELDPEYHTTWYYPSPNWWTEFFNVSGIADGGTISLRQGGSRPISSEIVNFPNAPGGACFRARKITLTRLTFTAPDGTEYELRDQQTNGTPHFTDAQTCHVESAFNRGRVFVTADGTSATFIADADVVDYPYFNPADGPATGYLLLPNGTRYRLEQGVVRWSRDRNGNRTTFTFDTMRRMTKVVDSLGREVTLSYDGPTTITYKGFGGVARTVKVHLTNLEQALRSNFTATRYDTDLFQGLNIPGGSTKVNPIVVGSVELPDSTTGNPRRYVFKYNQYAELARIELPTGGAIEYDYAPGLTDGPESGIVNTPNNEKQVYRRVVERRVYPDGGAGTSYAMKQVFSRPESSVSNSGYVEVGQCTSGPDTGYCNTGAALLSRERHHFYGSPRASFNIKPYEYASWQEGKEYRTEVFDPLSNNLLRAVDNTWQQPLEGYTWPLLPGTVETNGGAKPNNPQVTQTLNTLGDTGQVVKQTFAYDQYGNQTDAWEYGYGAPPYALRHTHTDYVTDAAYVNADANPALGASLRSLARARQVYTVNPSTGAETAAAKTETRYDEAGLPLLSCGTTETPILCSSAPQWDDLGAAPRGNATTTRSWVDTTNSWLEGHAQYDQLGNARFSWDARGKVAEVSYLDSFCNNGSGCGTAGYIPNTFGFPTASKTPKPDPTNTNGSATELTASTVYDYYTGFAYSTTDANDRKTFLEYEGESNRLDRLKAVVRPDGGRTDFNYGDTVGNLYVQTFNDLDGGRRTESKRYFDGLGRTYRAASYENSVTAQPWLNVDTRYDALGRVVRTSMPYRAAGGGTPLTEEEWSGVKRAETTYDELGRVKTLTTRPDGAVVSTTYKGNRVLVTDPTAKRRLSETDALGRLTEVWEITPNDPAKYPGIEAVTSPLPEGLTAPAYGYRTNYLYDVLGNLRRVQQGAQERFFAYDSLGRLLRVKNPEQGVFTSGGDFPALTDPVSGNDQWSAGYVYDANGNLTKRIDARGTTATYGYDALNRNISISYSDGTMGVGRTYDKTTNGLGRLSWAWTCRDSADCGSMTSHEYDVMGRVILRNQHFWSGGSWSQPYTATYSYDLAGNATGVIYPSGHTVSYNYDAAGRLGDNGAQPAFKGTLGDGVEKTYASQVSYDERGGLRQEKFGTQTPVYNKRLYNGRGQLAEIRVSTHSLFAQGHETDWNRGAIINHYSTSGWGAAGGGSDNNGNLLRQDVFIPDDDQISGYGLSSSLYGHDALNRLSWVREERGGVDQWRQQYDYDRWGNRTINAAATQVYGQNPTYTIPEPQFELNPQTNREVPEPSNRLYAPGDAARAPSQKLMRYDPAGNLVHDAYTGDGGRVYDAENRMTAAVDRDSAWASYAYDADGRRVRRKASVGAEVWQVYGIGGELLAEYPAAAPRTRPRKEYGYRGGELLVTAEAPTRFNVALASGGATATAQNYTQDGVFAGSHYYPSSAVDGRRYAHLLPAGNDVDGFWRDEHGLASWLQVNFGGQMTIDEVDVYTVADYPALLTQSNPTATQTFTQYGVTSFEVQYWTGSAWTAVPGGSVTGNNLVWKKVTFPAVTTDKIRVMVNSAVDGVARVTEVEAWGAAGPAQRVNAAHTSQGGQATASSTTPDTELPGMTFPISSVNDGDRKGLNWEHGGGWRDGTNNSYPDWVQVEFPGAKTVDEVDVFTLQDNYASPSEPTEAMTFTQYGATAYEVQYWTGSAWAAVPGGVVSGSNKVWRKFTFPAVTTSKVRVMVNNALAGRSRLVEVEAWATVAGSTTADVRWLVSDQLGTPRMVVDETGSLANVSRHDYLPFGEELGAGVGGRTTTHGYSPSDEVRQGFTGYEQDVETRLNYAQTRYQSPLQGRFTSPDPLMESGTTALPQSWNRYAYVLNNPLMFTDPTGLIWGYKDFQTDDGVKKREFKWFEGDTAGAGYTAYTDPSYTFADGKAAWLADGGDWGWIEPVRPENSCLNCEALVDGVAAYGPAMETTILAVTAVNLAPAVAITSSGVLSGVGSQTLGLGGGASTGNAAVTSAALSEANAAQLLSPRPGAAGALQTGNGNVFTATSGRVSNVHPQVQRVLDGIPQSLRSPFHGRCCEVNLLSNALNSGSNPVGGAINILRVRGLGNPLHGTSLPPCSSCQQLVNVFRLNVLP